MDVLISFDEGVTLRDGANFRKFRVLTPIGTELGMLRRAYPDLIRDIEGDDHLWLSVEQVAALGPDEAWRRDFQGMIAHAATRGWTRSEGREVAAHVEAA